MSKVIAGCFVINTKNQVLLLRRDMTEKFMPGALELPSGKVEHGESLEVAAVRELKEETNVSSYVEPKFHHILFPDGNGEQFTFLAHYHGEEIVLTEHSEYLWVDPQDLPEEVDEFTREIISFFI